MIWLLLLHISAVVCWCGSLLYLFALLSSAGRQAVLELPATPALASILFRMFTTPAALIAIVSGTALFMSRNMSGLWLVPKLALVALLVTCHALGGWIVLAAEQQSVRNLPQFCLMLGLVSAILMPMILWLVLNKPF